jgi:hypothetical protein
MGIPSGSVDLSLRVHTEEDVFGPRVLLIQCLFNGEIKKEWMPVALAVDSILRNPVNGLTVRSAKIEFSGVYDEWGQSF